MRWKVYTPIMGWNIRGLFTTDLRRKSINKTRKYIKNFIPLIKCNTLRICVHPQILTSDIKSREYYRYWGKCKLPLDMQGVNSEVKVGIMVINIIKRFLLGYGNPLLDERYILKDLCTLVEGIAREWVLSI